MFLLPMDADGCIDPDETLIYAALTDSVSVSEHATENVRLCKQITASADLGCQGPIRLPKARSVQSRWDGVRAPLQLQLNQINPPLLKMKRFRQRADGPAVPKRDTLESLCSIAPREMSRLRYFWRDIAQIKSLFESIRLTRLRFPLALHCPNLIIVGGQHRVLRSREVPLTQKTQKQDRASSCQMVTQYKEKARQYSEGMMRRHMGKSEENL